MSVHISDKPEMNVVNVGDEVTQDVIDALGNASTPSSLNPFLTVSAGDSSYLEKDGGGTVVGTVVVDTDGTIGGNTATITGTSVEVSNYGIGTIKIDPVLGVTFADNTSQATAAVSPPSASTTVTGIVELADDAQIRAGQSIGTVPTTQGSSLSYQYGHLKRKAFDLASNPNIQSTGTGYGYAWLATYQNITGTANTAGFTRAYIILMHPNPVVRATTTVFNGKWGFGQGVYLYNGGNASNGYTLLSRFGISNGPTAGVALTIDDTTTKYFGWKHTSGSSIKLQVYNGTTYQETDTGYTPQFIGNVTPHYIVCWSDGAGTAYIEITKPDGTIVTASRTGCPTGSATSAITQSWVLQLSGTGTQTGSYNVNATPPVFSCDW
jgi:hypothetical protein